MKKLKGNAMLMLTAIIWGTAFVAQKEGMNSIGPFAFNGIRLLLAVCALIPVILIMGRGAKAENKGNNKVLIIGGIACGVAMFFASNIQQVGIAYTSVSHSGFITALYVVIVPILGLFLKKKVSPIMWGCVVASAIGLYLLCIPAEGFGHVNKGDIIMFLCAIGFAVHILIIDYFSPKTDGVKLSCIQFLVAGVLTLLFMPFMDPALHFELPAVSTLASAWLPLAYAGIMSGGVAYTLQIVAQKDTDPTIASMILCLESVFALIAGMIILGEMMSTREIVGCIVMFAAIVVANLPVSAPKENS